MRFTGQLVALIATLATVVLFRVPVTFASGGQPAGGWQIPAAGREEKSPLEPTPEVIAKGKGLYNQHCEGCHGPAGKGDGPDGDADQPPADLTDASRASINPDGVLFYKIWNGRRVPKMPAFSEKMSKDEVWAVVEYVKTLRTPAE